MATKDELLTYFQPQVERWRAQRNPYVWTLRLQQPFYAEARRLLGAALAEEGNARFLAGPDFAPVALIMAGEWYKREYTGVESERPAWVSQTDWGKAWRNSGLRNWQRWVHSFDGGAARSWYYSALVLGGLACVFECRHDRGNRLMRDLCRLFHGDEQTLPDATGRARALAQSILRGGSVCRFMMEMTDPASELSMAYLADSQEEVRDFRATILRINGEVLREKFRAEWMVETSPWQPDRLRMSLRVKLRSERVGGERRWFLSRDRAAELGFGNLGRLAEITVSVRFYLDGEPVGKEADVLHFQATGKAATGFNVVEAARIGSLTSFPERFDAWQLVARGDDGQRVDVDPKPREVEEFCQMYQTAGNPQLWGSAYRKTPSAVLFSDRCRIVDPEGHPVARMRMVAGTQPMGGMNWAEIPAVVTLLHPDANGGQREVRLRSPLAGCQVLPPTQWPGLFSALPGGAATVVCTDPGSGEETVRRMPLMFGLPRLRMSWCDEGEEPILLEAEEILYRQGGVEMAAEELREGRVEVTLRAKELRASLEVWHIPGSGKEAPLVRELGKRRARWADGKTTAATPPDPTTGLTPQTVRATRNGRRGERAEFLVWQPVRRREVLLSDRLMRSDDTAGTLYLSILNALGMRIRVFDESGYWEWLGEMEIDNHRKLTQPRPDTSAVGRGGITLCNARADLRPEPGKARKYGDLTMLPDPGGVALDYPRIEAEKSRNPFGPRPKGLDARAALKACLDDNLLSTWFASVRELKGEVAGLLAEILLAETEDYRRRKRTIIRRILWENEQELTDLEKSGLSI